MNKLENNILNNKINKIIAEMSINHSHNIDKVLNN